MPVSGPLDAVIAPGRISPTGMFSPWFGTDVVATPTTGTAPTPVATYFLSTQAGAANLTTASFTPTAGEIIVVKESAESGVTGSPALSPSGGGLSFTKHQEINLGGNDAYAVLWSATVGASPSSMSITVDAPGTVANWSAIVERWPVGTTVGTVSITGAQGSGAPLATITTTTTNSAISWAISDWNAVAPGTPTYRDGPTQENIHDRSPSNYVAYYAYQAATTAGAYAFGMTLPTGQKWSAVGVEIKAASTLTIRELVRGTNVNADITLTTGAGTSVDDLLVVIHGSDFFSETNMVSPTGTAGTWTQQALGDIGASNSHIKCWTRPVTVGGTQTVTVTKPGDNDHGVQLYVISGANTSSPIDVAAGTSGAASTSHVAPSISPTSPNSLLLSAVISEVNSFGDYTAVSGGMTNLTEDDLIPAATFATMASAQQTLTASGPTGTRTFTYSQSKAFAAISIAIKPTTAGGGGPTNRTVNQVTETDTAQPITRVEIKAVGQVTETDSAQPIKVLRSRIVAQVTETDTPQGISKLKLKSVLQATETDTSQTIIKQKLKAVLQVTETDTAQTITKISAGRFINQVTETDTAQPITRRKIKIIGQVSETDTTQPIKRIHRKTLGQVIETDTVTSITKRKIKSVGQTLETDTANRIVIQGRVFQVLETDTALPIKAISIKTLGQVIETDTVQSLRVVKRRTVLQVIETDSVTTVLRRKRKTLGLTVETDFANIIINKLPDPRIEDVTVVVGGYVIDVRTNNHYIIDVVVQPQSVNAIVTHITFDVIVL